MNRKPVRGRSARASLRLPPRGAPRGVRGEVSIRARDLKRLRRHVRAAERSGRYTRVSGFLNGRREWISGSVTVKPPPQFIYASQPGVAVLVPVENYYGFVTVEREATPKP